MKRKNKLDILEDIYQTLVITEAPFTIDTFRIGLDSHWLTVRQCLETLKRLGLVYSINVGKLVYWRAVKRHIIATQRGSTTEERKSKKE